MADKYAVPKTWLDNTAAQIQGLTGVAGGLTTAQMSAQLEIEKQNVQNALSTLATKGVTVPDGANSNNLVELIGAIEAGAKIVEGTFTVTSDVSGTPLTSKTLFTVTGLSFEPTEVVCWFKRHKTYGVGSNLPVKSSTFCLLFCSTTDAAYFTASGKAVVDSTNYSSPFYVQPMSNGFAIIGDGNHNSISAPSLWAGTYAYLAIS